MTNHRKLGILKRTDWYQVKFKDQLNETQYGIACMHGEQAERHAPFGRIVVEDAVFPIA